ncbi:MAG: hypothetical protein QOE70_6714 [Chthoniobacter sp.]|jgi:hypothetical protein|nr:hypothetical protein [Chthoniobacter sp.]
MRFRPALFAALLLLARGPVAPAADDYIERLQDFLTVSAFDGAFRVRLSGTIDVEDYQIQQPAPGLLYTDRDNLFNARLTLFLDAQVGAHVYAFVQSRLDRGFDPGDGDAQIRLDEYALRFTPWDDGRFSLQIGKFATVAGNAVQRHLSWDNPFITAPIPYENLTGLWDSAAPDEVDELIYWARVPYEGISDFGNAYDDKPLRIPIVWGPSYATGLSVAGHLGKFEYAAEVKNASLSSRPEYWDATALNFEHPTFTGRLGFRPNQMWNLGFSASTGAYLLPEAAPTLPPGRGIGDYHEQVLAQDLSFEWHHLQIWAEFYEARFEVPNVGNADTFAYYVEAKYKLTPQLFGALRWNQQIFGKVPDEDGPLKWGNDLWRIDAALGYRFTPHTQLKLQYSLQHEDNAERDLSSLFAAQFTLRF